MNSLTPLLRHSIGSSVCAAVAIFALASQPSIAFADDPATAPSSDPAQPSKAVVMPAFTVEGESWSSPTGFAPIKIQPAAIEPQSTIGRDFIANALPQTDDFTQIANFAPSVMVVPTGVPGAQESFTAAIRGFQDGQYNVTFDGIPFGDTNDFTHHSNNYFTSQMLETVVVDRGPGTAATQGHATFGGTIALVSRALSDVPGATFSQAFGNFNTSATTATFSTGRLSTFGDARATFGWDHMETDGYQSYAGTRRTDYFFKFDRHLGASNLITFVLTKSDLLMHPTAGLTLAQLQQYGPTYGLNNDPKSQAYVGYNYVPKATDFEYVGFQHRTEHFHFTDKVYSYHYDNLTRTGMDLSGETPNGTTIGGPGNQDVPGQIQPYNGYRAWGNILRLGGDVGALGGWKAGLWSEYQKNTRYGHNVDWTLGGAYDELPSTPGASLNYFMKNSITTWQPYAEFDWKPLPGMTVEPGVKFISLRRQIAAPVNQKTQLPLYYSKVYSTTDPSVSVNERINSSWSAYAQFAKGYLAPNLNFFYATDPSASHVDPQETTNYQAGAGYEHGPVTFSFDGYYIDFNNEVGKRKIGNNTIFFNQGGTTYKGVEAEGAVSVGKGLSLYANGSINSATDKQSGDPVPESPKDTAAVGLLYHFHAALATFVTKYVGSRYGDTGRSIPLSGYATTTASIGYSFEHPFPHIEELKVRLSVDNLFNSTKIDDLAGYTPVSNTPMYWTIPNRSYLLTVSVAL
ncbi:vitamin B12/cobalamin outer membrane transporter [mine drainage metagenome]|uniref:Vitamin B12/cobalamin outer membrane transporter n=1 Tax=mine drainage metagenome TaxID=410659 RepID=A0A1J5T6E4_9ZZZZ